VLQAEHLRCEVPLRAGDLHQLLPVPAAGHVGRRSVLPLGSFGKFVCANVAEIMPLCVDCANGRQCPCTVASHLSRMEVSARAWKSGSCSRKSSMMSRQSLYACHSRRPCERHACNFSTFLWSMRLPFGQQITHEPAHLGQLLGLCLEGEDLLLHRRHLHKCENHHLAPQQSISQTHACA